MALRPASVSYFSQGQHGPSAVRGQNFIVQRFDGAGGQQHSITSSAEVLFMFAQGGGELATASGTHRVEPRSFAIAPPGKTDLRLDEPGQVFALTTGAAEPVWKQAINAGEYGTPDARVKPVQASGASAVPEVRIHPVDQIPFPPGNPRLKFLQTATMSVNWVEYEGPRNRAQLSPHAHADFQQGSLAIAGNFIHHIRTPWGSDANQWRDDEHIEASADSLLIVPPELVHTTEGVGDGRHILIDVFAPPREDFIAKGWVHNAGDYAAQGEQTGAA